MSVWDVISRADFEQSVSRLYEVTHFPRASENYRLPETFEGQNQGRDSFSIPARLERQLADDFAFIAAWETVPGSVTAATIACSAELDGSCLTLAANGGISQPVQDALQHICKTLQQCALGDTQETQCSSLLLSNIVDLNRDKLWARLGSAKYKHPEKWQARDFAPLANRLKEFVKLTRASNLVRKDAQLSTFLQQLAHLQAAIKFANDAAPKIEHRALVRVVKSAHLVAAGSSLKRRLDALGYTKDLTERKEVRQTQALANYWRVCLRLTAVARRYPRPFSSLTIRSLARDPASSKTRNVHAEVQLLYHHELETQAISPRFIGASKKACFLCDVFLRAYGGYGVSGTHGELYKRWTVPERNGMNSAVLAHIQRAIQTVSKDIDHALVACQVKGFRRGPPIQSALNSEAASLRTASVLTIREPLRPSISPPEPAVESRAPANDGLHTSVASDDHCDLLVTEKGKANDDEAFECVLNAGEKARCVFQWVHVHLELEDSAGDFISGEAPNSIGSTVTQSQRVTCRALQRLESESVAADQTFDLLEMGPGEERTFQRPSQSNSLSCILRSESEAAIELVLTWHTARNGRADVRAFGY